MYNCEPKIRIDFRNKKCPYRLMNNVTYSDKDLTFNIYRGFNYDGATIPRCLWFLVGSKGDIKLLKPALAHDWLCLRRKKYGVWKPTKVFYRLLVHYGTGRIKAFIMCFFVLIWQIICVIFEGLR